MHTERILWEFSLYLKRGNLNFFELSEDLYRTGLSPYYAYRNVQLTGSSKIENYTSSYFNYVPEVLNVHVNESKKKSTF